jgi:hypothetical protein
MDFKSVLKVVYIKMGSKEMFLLQVLGYLFLGVASIASSVSMNFQKLAANEIVYEDPRTKLKKRNTPLKSPVYVRPLFVVAIFLSAAASTLDFLALTWLPPATIGVFGSMSIIINLAVTRVILFEKPNPKEWVPIAYVIIGCMLAISMTPEEQTNMTPPQLLERPQSCVYIVANWVVFILCSIVLKHLTLPAWFEKIGYPFIGGALGAQNVCMGKYMAYAVATMENGQFTVRTDVFVATLLLCIASVVVHIVWLNKGLEKYDAYYCIIVYQTAWFMFTTLSGIVVYDNIAQLDTFSRVVFASGVVTAAYGVQRISKIHGTVTQNEDSPDSYPVHNPP